MRVLLVEDDQLVTNTAANALAQESYVVDVGHQQSIGLAVRADCCGLKY